MRSLNWKLGGALLLVVIVSIGLMAYLVNIGTSSRFRQYTSQSNQSYAVNVAAILGSLYERDEDWDDVDQTLTDLLRSSGDRLVLVDSNGLVVGDTADEWVGDTAADAGLSGGTAVVASGETVGEVFFFSSFTRGGRGYGYAGGSQTLSGSSEQDFLDQVNRWLIIVAVITALLALALGLVLVRQIVRPVKLLNRSARQVAGGNLACRVDITSRDELGDLGRSFNTMAASLEEAEAERRRIIADISHELRTPLTVIEGTVDGIQDGVFQADGEHLEAIKEQTALLTRLAADLRDLSLAESGQLKLQIAPVDLADLLQRQIRAFAATAGSRGIELASDLAPGLPPVEADVDRIDQVIANLMTNAIRHTPPGGRITVSARPVDTDRPRGIEGPAVQVSVADTGEGISAEHLPHVFDRFYRVEQSRSRGDGGAGLGLAIVRQMVQAHGGAVWAQSQPGRGSTFHVALPRHQPGP